MQCPVTIVSCFYPLKENKRHTLDEYYEWVKNFLTHIHTPIVMFSDGDAYHWIENIRREAGLMDAFFLIRKPLSELEFATPDLKDFWDRQCETGPWKGEMYQTMYHIWLNKCFFVQEAIEKNPFASDYFVWCDAGCWRNPIVNRHLAKHWPSTHLIEPNRLLFLVLETKCDFVTDLEHPDIQTHEDCVTKINSWEKICLSGTILAGDKKAWEIWTPLFKKTVEYYIKHNIFAGDDQTVIVSTYLWMYKSMPEYVPKILIDPITLLLNSGTGILLENTLINERFYQLQVVLSQECEHLFR